MLAIFTMIERSGAGSVPRTYGSGSATLLEIEFLGVF
jgi:hypothetical protein